MERGEGMLRQWANHIVDTLLRETSAANLSHKKEVVIGNVSYKELRSGIEKLHASYYDSTYASLKFERSIQSYKEVIRK